MKRILRLVTAAAFALGGALTATAAGGPLEAMAGAWQHRSTPEEERLLAQAVERVTADLGWAYRGAVRAFLRSRIAPAERLDIRWRGGELRIERDGETREPLPLGFPPAPWEGARAVVEPDGSLVVRWYGRFASGDRRYRLRPDGGLLVDQELRSERFSAPLRFETIYRRRAGAGAGRGSP